MTRRGRSRCERSSPLSCNRPTIRHQDQASRSIQNHASQEEILYTLPLSRTPTRVHVLRHPEVRDFCEDDLRDTFRSRATHLPEIVGAYRVLSERLNTTESTLLTVISRQGEVHTARHQELSAAVDLILRKQTTLIEDVRKLHDLVTELQRKSAQDLGANSTSTDLPRALAPAREKPRFQASSSAR